MSGILTFNVNDGFIEGMVRGFRKNLLDEDQYNQMTSCESTDDVKAFLVAIPGYRDVLKNEPAPIAIETIRNRCIDVLVAQFDYLRANAADPLSTFLDYIRYGYMIDNVILIILGTLNGRTKQELKDRCHPLGLFQALETTSVAETKKELKDFLLETDIGPYMLETHMDDVRLDEERIEIIRNQLWKAYLTDFYHFCMEEIGGSTADIMGQILRLEADRRCLNISLNSISNNVSLLSKDDREKLLPTIGLLSPGYTSKLLNISEQEQAVAIARDGPYKDVFREATTGSGGGSSSSSSSSASSGGVTISGSVSEANIDDILSRYEIHLHKLAFERQFHYGIFYSYIKLKEQEIKNIIWICECIALNRKDKIRNIIPIFPSTSGMGH